MNNVAQIKTRLVYEPSQTTHWKNLFPNKTMLLGSHNLNEGEELIATIDHVEMQSIKNPSGQNEEVPVMTFINAPPMVINITNVKTISSLYGPSYHKWKGQSIQIYAMMVKAFGSQVMGLRVRAAIPDTNENIDQYVRSLNKCTTMEELQQAFGLIPKHLKVRLSKDKDIMKKKIGASNVQS